MLKVRGSFLVREVNKLVLFEMHLKINRFYYN